MPIEMTRRQVMARLATVLGGAALGLPLAVSPGATAAAAGAASLALAAQEAGLMFGASASQEIFADPAYADLYRRETEILTTDVALKFDYLRWREGEWNFDEADRLLAFADANAKLLRGHCLVWNENAPDWLKRRSAGEIARIMDEHIDTVIGRYRGRLHSWDVVNEPFWPGHGHAGGYRGGPWYEAMGPDYVARAFRRAAAADPGVELVLNEAHCERDDEVGRGIRAGLLRLVDELLDQGVKLSAVGLQGHLQPDKPYDDRAFVDFLWQLAGRRLDLYISELDVDDRAYPADIAARDRLVGQRYGDFLGAVLQVPAVKAVICWQLADRYSWLRNLALEADPRAKRLPRPLPFDDALQPKPARAALLAAFSRRASKPQAPSPPFAR
jgi:endo-1,4-beta-xylanase